MKRRHPDCRCRHEPKCKHCNGTGRICDPSPPRSWECTSCNGTGIEGDPGKGLLVILMFLAAMAGLFIWAVS